MTWLLVFALTSPGAQPVVRSFNLEASCREVLASYFAEQRAIPGNKARMSGACIPVDDKEWKTIDLGEGSR